MHDGTFISYYGKLNEWKLYAQKDGTIIGYRSRETPGGAKLLDRVVTNSTDPDKFGDFLPKPKERSKVIEAPASTQLRIE